MEALLLSRRGRWTVALLALMLLLSFTSGVWAAPGREALRQTVPTRTPVPTEAPPTEAPPTEEPTEVPPTAAPTSKPEDDDDDDDNRPRPQPTAAPTEAPEQPTPPPPPAQAPAATATAAAVGEAGFPASGADYRPWIAVMGGLVLTAVGLVYAWRRRFSADR